MNKSPYIDLSIINNDINSFKQYYDDTLKSHVKLINTVILYISKSKGKQLRPILTLLGANISGKPNSNTYRSAALVEILHVATLIHDDIIDESQLRRGLPSISRIWKNKISLLIGDYLFSKVLSNMIAINNFDAFVALGCVIKGKTPHFKFISMATNDSLMYLSINYKKPIGNGIITCLNKKQALSRSNPNKKNKGGEVMKATLETIELYKQL